MMKLKIEPPIMNASGPASVTYEELEKLAKSASGAIVTKSMTHCPRIGNPEPRLKIRLDNELGSLNSMGLNNLGYREYTELIPKLREYKKPVIASISSAPCEHNLSLEEQYLEAAEALEKSGADMLEINLSTPNLTGIPIAMDLENIKKILGPLKKAIKIPIGVKLPPYNNTLPLFEEVARLLMELEIDVAVTMNSEPNALDIDLKTKTKVIKPREGYGGLGGPCILPIALAEVHRFYKYFKRHGSAIQIWGCGGITKAEDAIKHFLAGASAIQIGTALLWHGPKIFKEIWEGVKAWLDENGCRSVEEIVGTVKEL